MAGKRKCPFGETSPQQFKTHIGQKEATRMNNDLMREVFGKLQLAINSRPFGRRVVLSGFVGLYDLQVTS